MPETAPADYSPHLRQLLTDIATSDKKRLAAEATSTGLSAKLTKKPALNEKDLTTLGQLSAAYTASEQAKKEIGKSIEAIKAATVEPVRQVLLQAPLVLTVAGYVFTLSTAPNTVNAWMLDLTVAYEPA